MDHIKTIYDALNAAIPGYTSGGQTAQKLLDALQSLAMVERMLPKANETRCFTFSDNTRIRFLPSNGDNWQTGEMIRRSRWVFESRAIDGVWVPNQNIESIEFPTLAYNVDEPFRLKVSVIFPPCDSPF